MASLPPIWYHIPSNRAELPLYGGSYGGLHRAALLPLGRKGTRRRYYSLMPLEKTKKASVITEYAQNQGDTGSTEVQIALMQSRIEQITGHLQTNKKDFHSLRGLLVLVGKRRRLEAYLRSRDIVRYRQLVQRLGIREVKPR